MLISKVKCIFCNKKIVPNQDYCPKCGKDIRSMWRTEGNIDDLEEDTSLYCPNPKCRANYIKGTPFCNLCGNDFKHHPPVREFEFETSFESKGRIYCPKCGAINDNDDLYCDCGCDFRTNPKVSAPPRKQTEFLCAICNSKKVSFPDGICPECKKKEERREILCPECKINPVKKYGDICYSCMQKKPIKGIGEGFHIAK